MADFSDSDMKNILPFNENPLLKAHQFHAYMAGNITADKRQVVEDWLVSMSLRIFCDNNYFCVCYPGDCPTLLRELREQRKIMCMCFFVHILNLKSANSSMPIKVQAAG